MLEIDIYIGCCYLFGDKVVETIENISDNEIRVKMEDLSEVTIIKQQLSGIPMSIEILDCLASETSHVIGSGIKIWKFEMYGFPLEIIFNHGVFFYTNPVVEADGISPLPLNYLHELQNGHRKFFQNPANIISYNRLK